MTGFGKKALAGLSIGLLGLSAGGAATAKPPMEGPKTLAEATAGEANVSMWSFGDADSTVYLMGTVHILNPGVDWQSDAFDAAWAASDTVFLEADVTSPEAASQIPVLVQQLGMNPAGVTLSSYYSDDEIATLNEALGAFGLNIQMLDPLRPWLASLQVAVLAIQAAGGQADAGVEMILSAMAGEAGKDMRYFETAAQQMQIIAGTDDEEQARMLLVGAEDLMNVEEYFARLIHAWYTGNDVNLNTYMTMGFEEAPGVADALLYKRNEDWANQLDALVRGEAGTVFVAVGAGHVVGEKSVQDYLADRGYTVEKITD